MRPQNTGLPPPALCLTRRHLRAHESLMLQNERVHQSLTPRGVSRDSLGPRLPTAFRITCKSLWSGLWLPVGFAPSALRHASGAQLCRGPAVSSSLDLLSHCSLPTCRPPAYPSELKCRLPASNPFLTIQEIVGVLRLPGLPAASV